MIDRQPTKPNRYAVYDDNHNFLRHEYHERADEPTQEGDPLNSAGLMPDDVASALGLDPANNPQVKDGLLIAGDIIGDIKTTIRTDLGNNWLLCNGEPFDENVYPDLANISIVALSFPWTQNNQGSGYLRSVTYDNGYWVAVGGNGNLYYKQDTPNGSWTQNNQGTELSFNGVAYGNGYWVAVGDNGILYYKQGTPSGSWASNNQGTKYLRSVTYGNGYWVAVGDNGTLYYKQDTPSGGWASNNQGTEHLRSVTYGNGYWVAVGYDGTLYYTTKFAVPLITPASSYAYIRAK